MNAQKVKAYFRRNAIAILRRIVDRADEWIHREEVKLRAIAATAPVVVNALVACADEFDRDASAAREKAKRPKKATQPRLRYVAGEWVRS